MTGDSDKEFGNAGDSPLPTETPHESGDPLYRPLRGWASAYTPEPTLWSRISSGFGRMFSRKGSESSADSTEPDSLYSRVQSNADVEDLPVVRDYQLRGGEEVHELPVVREYQLHAEDPIEHQPLQAEPQIIPARSLLDDEPEVKKAGFFARLFGRSGKADAETDASEFTTDAAAEVSAEATTEDVPEVAPASGERLDRPSLEFFMRVDRAAASSAPAAEESVLSPAQPTPSLEDALPGAPGWAAGPEPVEIPAHQQLAEADVQNAEELFASFDEPRVEPARDDSFASIDDALPAHAEADVADTSFDSTMDTFAPTIDLGTTQPVVDLGSTMPEPRQSARSTVQVPADDEDTDTGQMVPPVAPEVSAAQEAERPPFFVPKFRAFYNEIVSHKAQKAEFTAGFATAVMDYTADLSPDAAAQQLSKRLQEILELQAAEATWMGGEAAARFPDAQYAMAALADEVFTNLDWPGRDGWSKFSLEQKLFKSNARDVEFFRRVDRLLKSESDHPSAAAKDLARMYLLVLAAGFQGKYRPFGLMRPLAEYRRRLFEFVSGKDPLLLYGEQRKLFPEAADRVVAGRAVSRFSMLQQWAAVLIILIIGYAVISQMAWNRVSADLKDVTARVEAANSSSTADGLAGDPR